MLRKFLLMDDHVCPWWLAYSFDNPVRRWLHPPQAVLGDLVQAGQTVADIGCGMGHFTLGLAELVGPDGKVIAVDLQAEMLARVGQRAKEAGLAERVALHPCQSDRLDLPKPLDFVLAFWMVHEVPEQARFLAEIRDALRPGGRLLVAEPKLHVSKAGFEESMETAVSLGFTRRPAPPIRFSYAALLER